MRSLLIRFFILLGLFFPTLASAGTPLNLTTGWNLLGNSNTLPIDVATTFWDASKITTVWKWNKTASKWAFYAPLMPSSDLETYALGKGYDVLTSIDPKEGFWLNASTATALAGPTASGVTLAEGDLQPGWNLVSSVDNQPPSQLNQGLSSSLNAAGKAIVTAWAWDAQNTKWKFYAPSLEAQGGTKLADYLTNKGYLPFSTAISASDGFWLNIGAAVTGGGGGLPTVTGMSTSTGAAGTAVTITGTNFSLTPANNTVRFNGTPAIVTAATTTLLTATVPSGATAGTVSVTTSGGTATSAGSFTVITGGSSEPTITALNPNTGAAGTLVTITGTNFNITPALNTVMFNGTWATVTAATTTSLYVTAPSGATIGTVSVTTEYGTAVSADSFTVSTIGGGSAAQYFAEYSTKNPVGRRLTVQVSSDQSAATTDVETAFTSYSGVYPGVIQTTSNTVTTLQRIDPSTGAWVSTASSSDQNINSMMYPGNTTRLPATFSVGTTWVSTPGWEQGAIPAWNMTAHSVGATNKTLVAVNATRTVPAGTFNDCLQINYKLNINWSQKDMWDQTITHTFESLQTGTVYYSPSAGADVESTATSITKDLWSNSTTTTTTSSKLLSVWPSIW